MACWPFTSSLLHMSLSRSCLVGGRWEYLCQVEGVHLCSLMWGTICSWKKFWQVWKREPDIRNWGLDPVSSAASCGKVPQGLFYLTLFWQVPGRARKDSGWILFWLLFLFPRLHPFPVHFWNYLCHRSLDHWKIGPWLIAFWGRQPLYKVLGKECFPLATASGAWTDTIHKISSFFFFHKSS